MGRRTTASPFETFKSQLTAPSTYVTFAWYTISAFLFAEIYVWARPVDAGFGVINSGRAHERTRLNERAIAFRTLFLMLGVVQSLVHLFSDRDRVPAPARKVKVDAKTAPTIIAVDGPMALIQKAVPGILFRLLWTAAIFPLTAFLFYVCTPLRSIAWTVSFDILRFVYFLPAKQRNTYTGFSPILPFYFATVVQTSFLVLLWEITNAAFSAYIAQPPLRREIPLTSDNKSGRASDPNGSLISGLKSKKEFAQASAFYELLLITINFPERRRMIYSELDRVGGNSWSQISNLCLQQINGITTRISAQTPQPVAPPPEVKDRIPIAAPLKTDNVFAPQLTMGTPARTGEWAKSVAAKYGSSPGAEPVKDIARYAGRKLLTDGQRDQLAQQPRTVEKRVEGLWDTVIKSPVGWPFRQSFERKVTGMICGSPYSRVGVIVDAIDALARLVVQSVQEDQYGQVAKDVPTILRTYLHTLKAVQQYVREAVPHWSDVSFTEAQRSNVKEVNDVVDALSDGLAGMLGAFTEYTAGMDMGIAELKEIKGVIAEAATKKVKAIEGANGLSQKTNGTAPVARRQDRPKRTQRPEMEQAR